MRKGPTSERPVGGTILSAARVSRPQKRSWRAVAFVPPKTVLLAAGRVRRRRLEATVVAVTGSVGKTTTKTLLGAALATRGPTVALPGGHNRARGLLRTLRATDRTTRYLVQEVGASRPGSLDELLWALEPHAAVVTCALGDHLAGLGGPDGAAREKRKVVTVLPPDGLAVLNADDPRVRRMGDACPGRVVLAGTAADADVRIVAAKLAADARLRVTLRRAGVERRVETQLLGLHWASAVALAFAAAVELGADPDAAVAAIAAEPAAPERLEPVPARRGGTLLLDTVKATEASTPSALATLAALPAGRRVVVLGSLWDYADTTDEQVVVRVAGEALQVADDVLLYGPSAARAPAGLVDGIRIRAHTRIRALAEEVDALAGPGVVVLLKGTFPYDHLARVAHAGTHDVRCWSDDCTLRRRCADCSALGPRAV